MYRNKYQPNILSLLLSAGSKPLDLWKTRTKKGCVRKVLDDTIKLSAIEIMSENTSDSYIYTAPEKFSSLGISLPFIVLIVKNMNKYFSFRISIMDDKKCRRTFRISNFQTVTRLSNKWCTMPMILNEGWNIIQINLQEYTEKAFRTKYKETIEVQINASIRIRCIYFCDKLYNNEDLKDEYKIFCKKKEKVKYIPPQCLNKPLKKMTIKSVVTGGGKNSPTDAQQNETTEDASTNENSKQADVEPTSEKNPQGADMTEGIELYEESTDDPFFGDKIDGEGTSLAQVIGGEAPTEAVNETADNATNETVDDATDNATNDAVNDPHVDGDDAEEAELLAHIKTLEMDDANVLYEDVNYETYNNDDN
ncbi:Transcription factor iib [Plasmodium coatneyi]|uniref:Transcription factor iib n=1 Tax=Plasmodium coatneyi TaxID=208452 RepID=A0A1B1E1H2_9APIC|nr:Transcription factor iib [Plasmodium coatneyi]ANQ08689.1 Transcription factor iib [Plasmodium coatneyi]